jgi:acetyl-CoA synthetase
VTEASTVSQWSWDDALKHAGVTNDGQFNAGTLRFLGDIVWAQASGERTVVTSTGFQTLVSRIVASLEHMGVEPGDRVVGFLGRRPEAFAAAVATWRMGGIYVPLFTSFGTDAVTVRVEDSGARAAVTDFGNRAALGGAGASAGNLRVLVVDGRGEQGDGTLLDAASTTAASTRAEDPATIVYTSGTTSRPKGCVMPHRSLINLWPYVQYGLRLRSADQMFSTADPGWSFGLLTTGLAPLSLGHNRCLYEPGFDVVGWWQAIAQWQVTHLCTAPTGLRQLMAADRDLALRCAQSLRCVTTAGEALTADVVTWFRDQVGVPVNNTFGLTELGMLTANVDSSSDDEAASLALGRALPGFELGVVDDEGEFVDRGETGRLAVKENRHFLATTYWNREHDWEARRKDGWWTTEDLVRQDDDGVYWYVDRSDDIIVTAGYNVSPGEIERIVLRHPGVAEVGCVGAPDPRKGHVVVAHVVLASAETPELLDEVRLLVGGTAGWHAAPRRLVVHESLPKTESGKLRRRDLRESAGTTPNDEGRGNP